jgi:hypothetical protein
LRWGRFCPARLHCSLGIVSVTSHKNIIDHSCPSLITGGCRREWLRTKDTGYKMETKMPIFLLFLVNSWAQLRNQRFLAKAV